MKAFAAVVAVKRVQFALKVGDKERWATGPGAVRDIDPHVAVVPPAAIDCCPGGEAVLDQLSAAVEKQELVGRIVRHIDVRTTVVVEVGDHDTEPVALRFKPVFGGYVAEPLAALVLEQGVHQWLEPLRRAHVANDQRRESLAMRIVVERPIAVVAHVEIGLTVAVDVAPCGAGAPRIVLEAERLRNVNESA